MAWGQTRFKTGVNAWDYGAWGGPGFGAADIFEAVRQEASPFQLRQLYHRAGELGLQRDNPAVNQLRAGTFDRVDPKTGDRIRPGMMPRQGDVNFNFREHAGSGFGGADLEHVTGGDIYGTDHIDRVQELRDWAWDAGIGVGPKVDDYLKRGRAQLERESRMNASMKELKDTNKDLLALAQQAVQPQEPPKPTMPGGSGHFVHGTTRVQGYKTATKGRRSSTFRDRFRQTGKGFQSALSIAGGAQGATQSKVLNV